MASVKNIIKSTSGGSTITVVANYTALPDVRTVSGKFYWCSASQGTSWLPGSLGGTYYNSGMYYSNGTTWEYINTPYQATQSEVNTGTNTDKFVTPSTLKNASQWATKQDALGFTPENVSNKSTSIVTDQASNIKYPSVKSVYDWVVGLGYQTASQVGTLITSALATFKTANFLDANSSIQTQLNGKEPAVTAGTTSQYYRGDKSFQTLDKTAVGLANVDNTSDANKPVSTAQVTAIALKAPLPDFMGLTTAYVLANSTSLQKMFNVGSGGNGAFNTTANKTYKFTIQFDMTGLSASTGTISFGFLGTAVISSINYKANTAKQALATAAAPFLTTGQVATILAITSSTTATTCKGIITGIVRCTTAGTLIPAVATSVGVTTAQVEINSYAEFTEVGSNTITATSNIS